MKEKEVSDYYDRKYFEDFQKPMGEFGGEAELFKFQKHIEDEHTVLDFGCGGGFLLRNLKAKEKFGVEINPVARDYGRSMGLDIRSDLSELDNEMFDVIISNHCLEHVTCPHEVIKKLYQKLKPGGRIIIVVPVDSYNLRYRANDVNYHLYSFSPMNLGNILDSCGFKKINSKPLFHKWPPFFSNIQKLLGWNLFHIVCYVYGRLNRRWVQTIGTGVK